MSDRDEDKQQDDQSGDEEKTVTVQVQGKPVDQDGKGDDKGEDDDQESDGDTDDAPEKPPIYKRPLFWIITIPIVALLVIGGTLYYLHARQFESTDDAFVDAHIVRIAAQNSGHLIQVADIDNRHVDAGRLLAVVEPSGPETQLAEAQANVEQARAAFRQSLAQIDAAVANRRQADAAARAPVAAAIKAEQDLARYDALLRLDPAAVASQQLDQARANVRSTAGDARAARRQAAAAQAQVEVARQQAGAAQAAIGAREAQVRQANVTIGDLRLVAPVSGQVVNRQVNVGSYVAPGTQLMAIVPDRMWITANFKETQLTLMKIGQPIAMSCVPGAT